jgi:hypothetical protein
MSALAAEALNNESLVHKTDHLINAIQTREYAAYAALIFMVLPNLGALHIADSQGGTLDHLHTALRNLKSGPKWNDRHASDNLQERLSHIRSISYNTDKMSGVAYSVCSKRFTIDPLLNLPCVQDVELSVSDVNIYLLGMHNRLPDDVQLGGANLANITRLVVRHSDAALRNLQPLLGVTVQLQTFV